MEYYTAKRKKELLHLGFVVTIERIQPWLVWLSGLSADLQTKGFPVRFPVRTHAWVTGQVHTWGHMRDNDTLMFPSLFLLPFAPL